MARPSWEPTEEERRLVEHYVSIGYTQEQIASLMKRSVDSLDRHCRDELDNGALRVNAKIGGKLFQKAMAGDTTSLIFWAKTRMGWKETNTQELTGKDGGAIEVADAGAGKRLLDELARLKSAGTASSSVAADGASKPDPA